MSDFEERFQEVMRELHEATEAGLADIEQRLTTLEADRLGGFLPLHAITSDTGVLGRDRGRFELIKRRLERLERNMYLQTLRTKR